MRVTAYFCGCYLCAGLVSTIRNSTPHFHPLFLNFTFPACRNGHTTGCGRRHRLWDSIYRVVVSSQWPELQYWKLWTALSRDITWCEWGCQPFLYVHRWVGLNGYYFRSNLTDQCPGTAVSVIGTGNVTFTDGMLNQFSECFIDNVRIGSNPPTFFPGSENNWVYCEADSLPDSQHNVTLRAIVLNQNTFWFDRIVYSPSSSVNLDLSLIMVNSSDPSITYGPGWQDLGQDMRDIGKITLQQGANATVDFSGNYLAFMGQKSGLQSS